jgi:hypothetical protein
MTEALRGRAPGACQLEPGKGVGSTLGILLLAGWGLCGSCSQAPQPVVVRKAEAGGAQAAASQSAATSGAVKQTITPALPEAAAAVPHSSEAEPKSNPAAVTTEPPVAGAAAALPAGTAPTGSAPAAAAPPPAAEATPARTASGLVVPIDAATPDADSPQSLVEAAKAERERKAQADPPRIVIDNKSLHRYAKGGQLTVAAPKKKGAAGGQVSSHPNQTPANGANGASAATSGAAAGSAAAAGASVAPLERDEKYWRGRALEIRQRWRKAVDRIKVLEQDANLWRRRFYAEDDPYVRDGQIKPTWDRVLDELRDNRAIAQSAQKELTDFMEEGRMAGALPGWLREGIDLEPKPEKPVDPTQPIETPIYKNTGR